MKPFIDVDEIQSYIDKVIVTDQTVDEVIRKSLNKKRLNLEDVAVLVNADSKDQIEKIKKAASELKEKVYGNRIVLFAPLYVGNLCSNNCKYC